MHFTQRYNRKREWVFFSEHNVVRSAHTSDSCASCLFLPRF